MPCSNPGCPCECHFVPADPSREWDDCYGNCRCNPPRLAGRRRVIYDPDGGEAFLSPMATLTPTL
jgi:hypothetical protein